MSVRRMVVDVYAQGKLYQTSIVDAPPGSALDMLVIPLTVKWLPFLPRIAFKINVFLDESERTIDADVPLDEA